MIATDARAAWRWTGNVIDDPRVVHFWDDQKVVGRWFARQDNPAASDPGIVWDAYYLYGPEAAWTSELPPLISRGATVVDEFEGLRRSLSELVKQQ